jgi:hypothetical protein
VYKSIENGSSGEVEIYEKTSNYDSTAIRKTNGLLAVNSFVYLPLFFLKSHLIVPQLLFLPLL